MRLPKTAKIIWPHWWRVQGLLQCRNVALGLTVQIDTERQKVAQFSKQSYLSRATFLFHPKQTNYPVCLRPRLIKNIKLKTYRLTGSNELLWSTRSEKSKSYFLSRETLALYVSLNGYLSLTWFDRTIRSKCKTEWKFWMRNVNLNRKSGKCVSQCYSALIESSTVCSRAAWIKSCSRTSIKALLDGGKYSNFSIGTVERRLSGGGLTGGQLNRAHKCDSCSNVQRTFAAIVKWPTRFLCLVIFVKFTVYIASFCFLNEWRRFPLYISYNFHTLLLKVHERKSFDAFRANSQKVMGKFYQFN